MAGVEGIEYIMMCYFYNGLVLTYSGKGITQSICCYQRLNGRSKHGVSSMNKSFLWSVVCTCLVFIQLPANAEPYVYAYTGKNYDTFTNTLFNTSMGISGHFEFAEPLGQNLTLASINPVSYSFTNGVSTLTETTSTSSEGLFVSTDETGKIVDWSFSMSEGNSDERLVGDKYHIISTAPVNDLTFFAELISITGDGLNFSAILAAAYSTVQAGTWDIYNIRTIDITPNNNTDNAIKLMKEKHIKVAILGDETFDALQVDLGTVKFGPTGLEASPIRSKGYDYDHDGYADMMLTFKVADTGIGCEDTEAVLTGKTYTEPAVTIKGTDYLVVICK